jgi:cytochrome P450
MDYYRQVFAETFAESRFADTANGTPFDMVAEFYAISKRNMLRGMLGVTDNEANRQLAGDILELSAGVTNPGVILAPVNKPWTPYGRWVGKVSSAYDRLAALIEERRLTPGRLDALSIVCNTTDEDGSVLSTEEIAGELHAFFSAGFETTAMTMTWALLTMLAGRHDLDPAAETTVDAVIKESQRLIPAVPMSLPRRLTADVSIGGSAPVPAGSMLFLSAVIEHHNPRVYAEPFAFRPQRWIDAANPKPASFFPFGIGARRCLGASFAELQARVTLGALAEQSRKLELLTTDVDYRMKSGVTGAPRKPIMVRYAPTGSTPEPPTLTGTVTMLWKQD